jgi:hypothetical protein
MARGPLPSPQPYQPGQLPADEVAGEVLRGDTGVAPLPPISEFRQVGSTISRMTAVTDRSDTSLSRIACAVGSSKA